MQKLAPQSEGEMPGHSALPVAGLALDAHQQVAAIRIEAFGVGEHGVVGVRRAEAHHDVAVGGDRGAVALDLGVGAPVLVHDRGRPAAPQTAC